MPHLHETRKLYRARSRCGTTLFDIFCRIDDDREYDDLPIMVYDVDNRNSVITRDYSACDYEKLPREFDECDVVGMMKTRTCLAIYIHTDCLPNSIKRRHCYD